MYFNLIFSFTEIINTELTFLLLLELKIQRNIQFRVIIQKSFIGLIYRNFT